MEQSWIVVLLAGLVLALGVGVFCGMRRSRSAVMQRYLQLAKQEAREIAQLPLNTPYPLIQLCADGEILFVNMQAQILFPDLRDQRLNHPILLGLDTLILNDTGKEVLTRELTANGVIYHQTIVPVSLQDQTTFIVYSYDITQRKAIERELEAARQQAEKERQMAELANQARGDFLANMSHELRTPMNGIIGLSDILLRSDMDVEHKGMVDAVYSSASNLLILLNDILDFSKIEAGELTVEHIPFDLRHVVKQIESLQKPVASRKGLLMKSEVDESFPAFIMGDPSRLQQILNNLINNAIKFTADGSVTLSVSGEMEDDERLLVRISVTDTGIGIPKNKQRAVFAKFQQADTSTARKYGGTGLGLAITKQLSELMGGAISLTSEEGKGTTFMVTLPTSVAQEVPESVTESVSSTGLLNLQARLLLVDDTPTNLIVLRQFLKDIGFTQMDEAHHGREAIEMAAATAYDLILMDCQMPEMDGFEATAHLRSEQQEGAHRPVIVAVTADAMKGAKEKCTAAGMDDYISKPIERKALHKLMQRWLPGGDELPQAPKTAAPEANPVCDIPAPSDAMDWEHFNSFTHGNKELEAELLDVFLRSTSLDVAKLACHFRDKNYEDWTERAHKIYGSAANIGARRLAAYCDEAQELDVANDVERIKALHPLMLQAFQQVRGVLKDYPLALAG